MKHARRLLPAALALAALGAPACGARQVWLQPVLGPTPEARVGSDARVELVMMLDRRPGDDVKDLGTGLRTDTPLVPWLGGHLRTALAEERLAREAGAPDGALEVRVAEFAFEPVRDGWVRGVAIVDLSLARADGRAVAQRLEIRTTELVTDESGGQWSFVTTKLARWTALSAAQWARSAALAPPVAD